MAEFLFDQSLGLRIREVASGAKVCCAIAFWSEDGVAQIFPNGAAKAKIVCDISMGSTSADALTKLGGPNNRRLRHKIGMHAKVCLSDKGLVVSSANASSAALCRNNRPGHHWETGTFHVVDSETWKAAAAWFENLFRSASQVGTKEIEWAKSRYRPGNATVRQRLPYNGSLLDLVFNAPERFLAIGFVFTSTPITKEQEVQVRKYANTIDPQGSNHVKSLPGHGIFCEWHIADVKRWPSYFFEFYQPNERLYVLGRRLEVRAPQIGSLMSVKDWPGLRATTEIELPSAQRIEKIDGPLSMKVRGNREGAFFASGVELAQCIDKLK